MKKVFSLLFMVLMGTMIYAASLRDYVCVVRGNLSEKNTKFLTELSDGLTTRGYKRYGEYINSYLKGTFGSGFIYYINGKPFILTNRHVVQSAENATVTFENEDGSTSEFKNLKIIYIDENVDLAVLQLPEGFKRPGLIMNQSSINDGDDVWSAGFPGLGGEPAWQLGKGVVSNSRAKIKQLLDPEISTLIQHTAEIDGGNSGGPLLVKNSADASGYRVAGINTWKAIYRENTNFAIPAACVKATAETGVAGKKSESFDSRMKSFVKALKSDEEDFDVLSKFISDEMIEVYGKDVLIDVLSTATIDSRNAVVNTFASNPIEGLRMAAAYEVWLNFNSSKSEGNIAIGEKESLGTAEKISFTYEGDDPVSSCWVEEKGNWRMQKIDCIKNSSEKSKKSKTKGKRGVNDKANPAFVMEYPYVLSVNGGAIFPFNGSTGCDIEGKYNANFIALGVFFTQNEIEADVKHSDSLTIKEDFTEKAYGLLFNVHVPFKFDKAAVIPFGGVRAGFCNFGDFDNGGFYFAGEGGLEGLFLVSDDFGAGLGAKYQYAKYSNGSASAVSVYLKIDFCENSF